MAKRLAKGVREITQMLPQMQVARQISHDRHLPTVRALLPMEHVDQLGQRGRERNPGRR